MFKYLWIIVLAGIYILWTVKAWKEFYDGIREYGKKYTLQEILCDCENLEVWVLIHLFIIFTLSVLTFVKNPPPAM